MHINRHDHRISRVSSLGPGKWICGVCRELVNGDQCGVYSCMICSYVVHSRCATRPHIWDRVELEGIAKEEEEEECINTKIPMSVNSAISMSTRNASTPRFLLAINILSSSQEHASPYHMSYTSIVTTTESLMFPLLARGSGFVEYACATDRFIWDQKELEGVAEEEEEEEEFNTTTILLVVLVYVIAPVYHILHITPSSMCVVLQYLMHLNMKAIHIGCSHSHMVGDSLGVKFVTRYNGCIYVVLIKMIVAASVYASHALLYQHW
ncbi:unnamed protein product [Thlaspi arvense]|uniref:DC1 domain-containing protein n=1 Tax=Thlaspi arvense TaxID=13288 RepID=A0AAU9T6W0_THLAR|nr:unnamed protein product [Thlaspi arvense]